MSTSTAPQQEAPTMTTKTKPSAAPPRPILDPRRTVCAGCSKMNDCSEFERLRLHRQSDHRRMLPSPV